jgi:integrase
MLNQHWLPTFANRITREITSKEIKSLLTKTGLSQKRKSNILGPLRGVFDFVGIQPNPAAIKLKKGTKRRIQRFTPAQRMALMETIDAMGNADASAYFALLLGCGLRPSGEPFGLTWQDWDGTRLHVHRTIVRRRIKETTKTHEDRMVYVPKWVRPYLNALPSRFKDSWIFLRENGKHYRDAEDINRFWQRAFETKKIKRDLKMEYQTPYVCRHTRAAELLSTGVEPYRAAGQLGHTVEVFFRTYAELIEEYSRNSDDDLEGYRADVVPDLSKSET